MTKETKVTSKYQTSIPKEVRKILDIKPGKEVEWNIVKGMVIVDTKRKIANPTKFLTSQIKTGIDAVKLVKEARNEFK
ncbi:MAG TPA: AbrB/MazE/SpoVT family DNA-binding domain-containing protein [archaeon]|nr:AbrB/MazE/SpoVT family DNA-binding domain-containing protein [archaeon]